MTAGWRLAAAAYATSSWQPMATEREAQRRS